MITISSEQLWKNMTQQEILGVRIFDMNDNTIYLNNPAANQNKSKEATQTCVKQAKTFFETINVTQCKVRLKKYHNTNTEDELVYKVVLDEYVENTVQGTKQEFKQETSNNFDVSKTVAEQVKLELDKIRDKNKVDELQKELDRLKSPLNRAGEVLGNAAEIGITEFLNWIKTKNPTVANNMQGSAKEKIEDVEFKEEKDPKTDEEKMELAMQRLWQHGVDGNFMLALADRIDADPSLLEKLQKLLNLPKLNKDE